MEKRNHDIVVLALGNELLGDDAVGLIAGRRLYDRFSQHIDFVEAPVAGFALLDYLCGYRNALILDSIVADGEEDGAVREVAFDELSDRSPYSPHYVGFRDVVEIARKLEIPFPSEIRMLAMEVIDPFILREQLTPRVQTCLPILVDKASTILSGWIDQYSATRPVNRPSN